MRIEQWWTGVSAQTRAELIDHNGDVLSPQVADEVIAAAGGVIDSSWWRGETSDGTSQLTDTAIDWIEEVANGETQTDA